MKLITTFTALAISTSLVFAADEKKPEDKKGEGKPKANPEEVFKKLDSNTDGSVSLDEFKAGPLGKKDPTKAEEVFKKKDKDSDGKLTKEEFAPAKKNK